MKYINQLGDCRDVNSMSLTEIAAAAAWWFQNHQPAEGFSPALLGETTYTQAPATGCLYAVRLVLEKLASGDVASASDKTTLFEAWLPGGVSRSASGTEKAHIQALWYLLDGQEARGRELFASCYH